VSLYAHYYFTLFGRSVQRDESSIGDKSLQYAKVALEHFLRIHAFDAVDTLTKALVALADTYILFGEIDTVLVPAIDAAPPGKLRRRLSVRRADVAICLNRSSGGGCSSTWVFSATSSRSAMTSTGSRTTARRSRSK